MTKEPTAIRDVPCPHCEDWHPKATERCPATGQSIDRALRMQGAILDKKYELEEILGAGGMAVVYRGRHRKLGRTCAIKVMAEAMMGNQEMRERFLNEARLAASVRHRNVVDVMDIGCTRHLLPYIVMELLEGDDLGEILDQVEKLPEPTTVHVVLQILAALKAIHEKDIVHRDLKPENVFVVKDAEGGIEIKIVDFGISQFRPPGTGPRMSTITGRAFGTPMYCSPEQARDAKSVDLRTDIYSAGVILYEMLTGWLPFQVDTLTERLGILAPVNYVHINERDVPLSEGLDEVVMKALSFEPDRRYQDAETFARALLPYRDEDQAIGYRTWVRISRPPPGPKQTPSPRVQRKKQVSMVSAPPVEEAPSPSTGRGAGGAFLWAVAIVLFAATAAVAILVPLFLRFYKPPPPDDQARAVEEPAKYEIVLGGLPGGAEVVIDGVTHPERPVVVDAPGKRTIEVEADGYESWQREIEIRADVEIEVSMTPAGQGQDVVVESTPVKVEPPPVEAPGKAAATPGGEVKEKVWRKLY
jgi:serine/threonine-protein kinase